MREKPWTICLLAVISVCRIGMGIYNALSGPTLLYLSKNVDVSVSVISTVFTARSVGNLLGAVLGGVIKHCVGPNFRHLLTLGAGVGILGLMDLAVPWITAFWVLICDITLGGIMYGYLDAGLQALLLQLWGEKASRPHIQLFHLMYSVGAFIAPLVANPFLAMANEVETEDQQCPTDNNEFNSYTTVAILTNHTEEITPPPSFDFNPIGWTYIIAAGWLILVSAIMIILSLHNVEKKVSDTMTQSGTSSENREEEPMCDLIWVFVVTIAYYFCCVTVANIFYNFIYSIAICSGLQFTTTQASSINSVFWLGYGLGRFCGIFVSPYLKPRTIIIASIAGAIVDMTLMCIWGESVAWVAWTVSGLHGFTTSLLYPSGVSWLSRITNISGTYLFIFNIGNALGSLTMLPLAGFIFDINPFSVNYLILALSILNGLVFAAAVFVGISHKKFVARKSEKSKIVDSHLKEGDFTYTNQLFAKDDLLTRL